MKSARKSGMRTAMALGGALLWGLLELIALWRSRWLFRAERNL